MNIEEQLNNELLNSIQTQKEMQNLIDKLLAENTFLTETITTHKLGNITIERRDLQSQMYIIQNEAKLKLSEAQKIRSKYEQVLYDVEIIKKRLSDKEKNIDKYIKSEASNQISAKIKELKQEKVKCKKLLDKHIRENDDKLESQISIYKKKRKNWILTLLVTIIITIISIVINFI